MAQASRASGVAVVTGAASGMGQAAAQLLAEEGWPVIACDIDAERMAATAAQLPGEVEVLVGDISDPGYGEQLVAALKGRPIGALVHCAGLSPTMASAERIFEVNLAATMRLVDVVRPRMSEGSAAVLFASLAAHLLGGALDDEIGRVTRPEGVANLAAIHSNPGTAYSVAKRGVLLLARREARSFGQGGARIVSLSPGIVDTPMGRAEMEQSPTMTRIVENSALLRSALSEEVAAVAAFLCSSAASFVTGTDILVDGGAWASSA